MQLTIIIPTIDGREQHMARCVRAYSETLGEVEQPYTLRTYRNYKTCGEVWQLGIEDTLADLGWPHRKPPVAGIERQRIDEMMIHLSADDLEPQRGWWQAALEIIGRGGLAAPYVFRNDGALDQGGNWGVQQAQGERSQMTTIPTFPLAWWVDEGWSVPPIHYFSDNAVSAHGRAGGHQALAHPGYAFTHHWASEGRQAMNGEQWNRERAVYVQLAASLGQAIA